MSVRVTCPGCGCRGDVEAFMVEEDAKRMAAGFAELEPALGRAMLRYLRVFKPIKRELSAARAARIIADLVAMVETGTVCKDERSGQRRPAPIAVWVEAIDKLLAAPPADLPLPNHSYLRSIVFTIAGEHQGRAPVRSDAPAVRHTGISPERPVDRVQEQIEWLGDQLRYKQIDQSTYEKKVADLRAKQ